MTAAALTSLILAAACAAATAIAYGMERDPTCTDPPCGGTRDTLIIYGTAGTIVLGLLALLLGLLAVTRTTHKP